MYYIEFLEIITNEYKNINIGKYKPLIEKEKIELKQKNDENSLLQIWFCLIIIVAIDLYHKAFAEMKDRKYYNGWIELGNIEVIIQEIKYNIPDCSNYITFIFLEKHTKYFQNIFPYKLFMSIVLVDTKEECSICGRSMNPYSECEHIRGKVYAGEICYAIVSDGQWIGLDMAEKPANKCAVLFKDLYNPEAYKLLEYLIPKLPNEYTNWNYKILTKYEPHSKYNIIRNIKCPCESGKEYKNCCLNNPKGVPYEHYEFLLPDELLEKHKN